MTYMQDMTPEGCAASTVNDTKQLIDKRDNKTYWVAKLKDGNCWMTQNLELDLSTSTPLTSELSGVTNSWTPTNSTYTSARDGTNDNTLVQSWNLGKYVWKTPNSTSYCGSSGVYDFSNFNCQSYWQNVSSGWTPMTEYRTDGVTYDANTKTYDSHYLAGNYYSYVAATAGTGTSATSDLTKATDSICPKGFELPTSGSSFNRTPGSFYNLLKNAYNISNNTAGGTAMRSAPLFFVHSGYVRPTDYLDRAGDNGYYWSSVALSSFGAYSLLFFSNDVRPSNGSSRYLGKSVRCVAPSA